MPSFMNPDGSFTALTDGARMDTAKPLTGATIVMTSAQSDLYVNPAGTIAALTIKLSPNPRNGKQHGFVFSQIVTALSIVDNFGNAIVGSPTTATAGLSIEFRNAGPISGGAQNPAGFTWIRWR